MKVSILVSYLLWSIVTALDDIPFDQEISFRTTFAGQAKTADWDQLPFLTLENTQSAAHLGPQLDCFISVSGGEIFTAEPSLNRMKLNLNNMYQPWSSIYTIGEGSYRMTRSLDGQFSFFIITDRNVIGFELSGKSVYGGGCGKLVDKPVYILSEDVDWGELISVTTSDKYIWIATSKLGLTQVNIVDGSYDQITLSDMNITSLLFVQSWNKLFVGTKSTLYTLNFNVKRNKNSFTLSHEWITGVIDSAPVQFSYDTVHDSLWLAETNAVHKLDNLGRWWRFGYHQGAPFGNITSVAAVNGYVYVGSKTGLARVKSDAYPAQVDTLSAGSTACSSMSAADTDHTLECSVYANPWKWSVYAGPRYLVDNAVWNIIPTENQVLPTNSLRRESTDTSAFTVLVVSKNGLTMLETSLWTLAEKSTALEQFQYPRHDRRKLTSGCGLTSFGDVSSYYKTVGDNDGLWTAMHGMGEAYHFAATGSEVGRREAWRAFEALEMLVNVTGAYPHFPARSYCYTEDGDTGCGNADGGTRWHNSTTYDGVMWKDDTSSDELNGHLSALPVLYDLVAQSEEEKKRVLMLIDGITAGIVKNDLYLIDPTTNSPTTWGFFNPTEVNDDPDHYSERGMNSLEILSYLSSAYSLTRNELYKDTFYYLLEEHDYLSNCMNVKIDNPEDDNHSDNELISLAYHILFYSWKRISTEQEPEFKAEMWSMVSPFIPSFERSWLIFGSEYSPLWTGIYAGVASQSASIQAVSRSVWTLRSWGLDLIDWPVDNSQRWDVQQQPFHVRDSTTVLLRQVRPPQERVQGHWNSDPFAIQAGSGYSESEPAVWKLPYFIMLYYKLIQ